MPCDTAGVLAARSRTRPSSWCTPLARWTTASWQSVCGARTASHAEHMLLVRAPEEALVSRNTAPVPMASMLLGAVCDDQAIAEAPDALVLQIASSYEVGGEEFPVDARVDWGGGPITLAPTDSARAACQCVVA